jgi:membrane-associated phospholipid phosphatase
VKGLTPDDGRDPTMRRPGLARLVAPLLIGVLSVLGTYATYRVFVGTITGQWADTAGMLGSDVQHERVAGILSRVLNGTTLGSLVLVCLVAGVVGVLRRRFDLAVAAAVLVVGANGTTQVLKDQLARPTFDGLSFPNSLPSGHTTAAASVAFALILVLPEAVRGVVALTGAGYTVVIATATVWARWHRPSDAVAAVLIVLGWGALVVLLVRLLRPEGRPSVSHRSRLATLPLLLIGGLSAPLGALGLIVVAMSGTEGSTPAPGRLAFAAGVATMVGVVSFAFLLWTWLAVTGRPAATDRPEDEPTLNLTSAG